MTAYYSQKVTNAEAPGGFLLRVQFGNGYSAEIDLATIPEAGPVFTPLHDPVLLGQVKANAEGVIEWAGGIILSARSLRAWCEAGHILNAQETDGWIQKHSDAAGDRLGSTE